MEKPQLCYEYECTEPDADDTLINCEQCHRQFHQACLTEQGRVAEDLSTQGKEGFEEYTEVWFCEMMCMMDFVTKVSNGVKDEKIRQ